MILKPKGKGNWRTQALDFTGPWFTPLSFRVGQVLELGGAWFRVCEVRP